MISSELQYWAARTTLIFAGAPRRARPVRAASATGAFDRIRLGSTRRPVGAAAARMQITPEVHRVARVVCNVYLIDEPAGLTIIDAGLPFSERRILRGVASLGRRPTDVRRILITHADRDHIGGLAGLRQQTGAQVLAGELEGRAIAAGRETRQLRLAGWAQRVLRVVGPWLLARPRPAKVDAHVAAGDVLPVLGGLRVIAAPGHTPGHLAFFAAAHGILFAGDALRSVGRRVRASNGPNTWDESIAAATARQLEALGARLICCGHGPEVRRM